MGNVNRVKNPKEKKLSIKEIILKFICKGKGTKSANKFNKE